ncbi:peptidoglycan DD-metalloendopeptidase family protein [Salinispirillum sp. LH 10-3-1]|uniref:Peptidoglycan DD-metalloendopeptidase family protein n=1 Tax=Salinispirillum sp. LH 10-3-1 TaxID=2952525 RepID=A0AB38YFV2_9GAMM
MLTKVNTLPVPRLHLVLILFLAVVVAVAAFFTPSSADGTAQPPEDQLAMILAPEALSLQPPLGLPGPTEMRYTVQSGDTLSTIFDRLGLGQTVMYQILGADEAILALDTIRPGQTLWMRFSPENLALEEMELFIHAGNRILYRRVNDTLFEYEELITDGEWHNELVSGEIAGIFYLSAQRAGLSIAETATVTSIFQDRLDFARSIQAGDRFQVVRSVQYVDGEPTGQTRIESARIQRRNQEHSAFLFSDGRYYDSEGQSLARAFMRLPMSRQYRISSSFNPRRVHPVTGRIAPHNGTDFAMPIGTPVLTTGDGVVTRVGNHPFAGRYVEIQHGGQYKTRYLHLDRVLVNRGQTVTRGQRIALSGNTGRSTGPHLHFELHVNGRPVNPMTANIPLAQSVPDEDYPEFLKRVEEQIAQLDGIGVMLAGQHGPPLSQL